MHETRHTDHLRCAPHLGSIAAAALVCVAALGTASGAAPWAQESPSRPLAPSTKVPPPASSGAKEQAKDPQREPSNRTTKPAAGDGGATQAPAAERSRAPAEAGTTVDAGDGTLVVSTVFVRTRPASAPPLETAEERSLEQLGRLVHSRVELRVEEQPLREVLRAVRKSLGINLVVFEAGDAGAGIDGDLPVSLTLEGVPGREVLETLASLSGLSATWQLQAGTVEFGPKSVLARDSARRTQIYLTTDLSLDPPDWENPLIRPDKESYNRRDSDENIGELVRMLVSHCEPEAFHAPPPQMVEDADGRMREVRHTAAPPSKGNRSKPSGRTNPNTMATINYDPDTAQIFVVGQWAAIQAKDNNIAVSAPDFVHRAIDGYEAAIPPKAGG